MRNEEAGMTPPWDLRKRVDEADFGDAEFVTVKDLRIGLSEIINRVAFGGAQIVVRRHGRPVVAIVTTYDLQACQALEAQAAEKVDELRHLAHDVGQTDDDDMDEDSEAWDEVTDKYGPW
jgi:prevent-host-death family protein